MPVENQGKRITLGSTRSGMKLRAEKNYVK